MSIDYEYHFDFGPHRSEVEGRVETALMRGIEHIHERTTPRVPVDTGKLVGSAILTVTGFEARITYPGPYARYQHYVLHLKHTVGQALYLEQTMMEESQRVNDIMARELGKAFR